MDIAQTDSGWLAKFALTGDEPQIATEQMTESMMVFLRDMEAQSRSLRSAQSRIDTMMDAVLQTGVPSSIAGVIHGKLRVLRRVAGNFDLALDSLKQAVSTVPGLHDPDYKTPAPEYVTSGDKSQTKF